MHDISEAAADIVTIKLALRRLEFPCIIWVCCRILL
jgi:hypothetical protein